MSALTLATCACGCERHFVRREETQQYAVGHAPRLGVIDPNVCIDCGRPVTATAKRCHSCAGIVNATAQHAERAHLAAQDREALGSRVGCLHALQAMLREWPRPADWDARWLGVMAAWRVAA